MIKRENADFFKTEHANFNSTKSIHLIVINFLIDILKIRFDSTLLGGYFDLMENYFYYYYS